MLVAYLPIVIAIIGLLLWALTEGKLSEAGRLLFFAGVLAACLTLAGRTVRIP